VSIRRNRNVAALTRKAAELGVAAPLVIAHRLTRMALAGHTPSVRDRREFTLMSTEKTPLSTSRGMQCSVSPFEFSRKSRHQCGVRFGIIG
jgi:hypothetical protein